MVRSLVWHNGSLTDDHNGNQTGDSDSSLNFFDANVASFPSGGSFQYLDTLQWMPQYGGDGTVAGSGSAEAIGGGAGMSGNAGATINSGPFGSFGDAVTPMAGSGVGDTSGGPSGTGGGSTEAFLLFQSGALHNPAPYSGNAEIDAALIGSQWGSTVGTAHNLTFSFPTNANQYQAGY